MELTLPLLQLSECIFACNLGDQLRQAALLLSSAVDGTKDNVREWGAGGD